jgi:hypothetical protein
VLCWGAAQKNKKTHCVFHLSITFYSYFLSYWNQILINTKAEERIKELSPGMEESCLDSSDLVMRVVGLENW